MAAKKETKPAPKEYVTDSNIPIKPFYQKSTKKKTKEEPGKFPFTRGIHQGMYRDRSVSYTHLTLPTICSV